MLLLSITLVTQAGPSWTGSSLVLVEMFPMSSWAYVAQKAPQAITGDESVVWCGVCTDDDVLGGEGRRQVFLPADLQLHPVVVGTVLAVTPLDLRVPFV